MSRAPAISPGVTLSRAVGSARFCAVRWGALAFEVKEGAALPIAAVLGAALLLLTLSAVPKRRGATVAPALPEARVFWFRISASAFSFACIPHRKATASHQSLTEVRALHTASTPLLLRNNAQRIPDARAAAATGRLPLQSRGKTSSTRRAERAGRARELGGTHPRGSRASGNHGGSRSSCLLRTGKAARL